MNWRPAIQGMGFLRGLFFVDADIHENSPFILCQYLDRTACGFIPARHGIYPEFPCKLGGLLFVPAVLQGGQCRHLLGHHFEANKSVRLANPVASTMPRG